LDFAIEFNLNPSETTSIGSLMRMREIWVYIADVHWRGKKMGVWLFIVLLLSFLKLH